MRRGDEVVSGAQLVVGKIVITIVAVEIDYGRLDVAGRRAKGR